jgi:hypothetical protein
MEVLRAKSIEQSLKDSEEPGRRLRGAATVASGWSQYFKVVLTSSPSLIPSIALGFTVCRRSSKSVP